MVRWCHQQVSVRYVRRIVHRDAERKAQLACKDVVESEAPVVAACQHEHIDQDDCEYDHDRHLEVDRDEEHNQYDGEQSDAQL